MREDYRAWLEAEKYSKNTCDTQISNLRKVERAYGDSLDDLVARGGLASLIAELTYSSADERRGRANPSKIDIGGSIFKGLMSAKSAVALYARYLGTPHELAVPPDPALPAEPVAEKQRLSLERDMQVALRDNIARLDPSLSIIDDGAERAVASGFIDILARDAAGVLVVIELKAGKTDARVIGQTLGYMGDILAEEDAPVRGIIVAHDFDQRTISAARAVPNLSLTRYAISFSFTPEV
jgi:hypothetical protein